MSGEESAVAKAWCDAYNAHDVERIASLYAASGQHVEIAQGRAVQGRQAIRQGLDDFLAAFPDAHWAQDEVIATATGAAIAYTLTGSLHRQLGPFGAHGQRLELRGMHLLRLSGTEIVESRDYWDSATFARQMRVDGKTTTRGRDSR
jgi:steroid delta-isomerase-like uncharacterized protein